MPTPWLDIPLADYEGHMARPEVAQAGVLATHFGALLRQFTPPSVAVVGCAGGNGFEHIDVQVTRRIVGIDINPGYLDTLARRHARRLPGLELHAVDVAAAELPCDPVDFVYAALLFEYVALAPALRNLGRLCRPGGVLATVLQLPAASLPQITPSPYSSLGALAPLMQLVAPATLAARASEAGFELMRSTTLALPSGKSFAAQNFRRSAERS